MNSPVPDAALPTDAQARLDHLIARIGQHRDSSTELVRERLQSARIYLLGGMPEEYAFSLDATKTAVTGLTDAALQQVVLSEVEDLLKQTLHAREPAAAAPPSRAPQPPMPEDTGKSRLYQFFQGAPTTLGVFYPTHFIFASFPSFPHAQKAARALREAGHSDLVSASASETLQFMNEIRSETGVGGALMAALSRFFGTEAVFTDIDVKKAEGGAGFLAVYCPGDDYAERIRDLAAPFEPLAIQLYLPSGVRSLWAGKSPGPQGHHPKAN